MRTDTVAPTPRQRATPLVVTVTLAVLMCAAWSAPAWAQAVAPPLDTVNNFAVLAGTPHVSNIGPTVITGDVGIHPGLAVIGFPPGVVIGSIEAGGPVALQAKQDLVEAYDALDQGCDITYPGAFDLVGLTLAPGVYCSESSLFLSGTLTLDAQFDPNAVWIFKTGSTLITASSSTVRMINGGQQCNVFWRVNSSATLGTASTFIGNILALTSITLTTGTKVSGRVLARNGAVTMDSNTVAITGCAVPPAEVIPPMLNKAFSPTAILSGGTSILTITLSNADVTDAAITTLTDTLPADLVVSGDPSTTCGGTVAATIGGSTVTLTGGSIAGNGGSCSVTVPVTATAGGLYTNTLGVGALQSSNGPNAAPAVATLNVLVPNVAPTVVKAFSPASINEGGISTLTITLSNTNATAANLNAALVDTLPIGVFVASLPGIVNTCGGVVTAVAGATTVTLSAAASIPANQTCSVSVNVTAPVAANYFNVLVAGALRTNQGNNAAPALATLAVVPILVPPPGNTPGLTLSKTVTPTTYTTAGTLITYTYVLKNTGSVNLTGPFTVNDDKLPTFTCGDASTILAPGASVICPLQYYTTQLADLGDESSLPQGVIANIDTGAWLTFNNSTQQTKITGASPGVPNGTYPCWCIQDHVPTDLHNQPARLYSTVGGNLPADVAALPWNKVNYTLNHKIRGAGKSNLAFLKDVQTAIWMLLGEQNPTFGVSATAQQMIAAADANPNYVPGSNNIVAVILYSDGMRIRPGSIQESICEMNSKLKTIVNNATGSVIFNGAVVKSVTVQLTVKQVAIQ
jgi:hypothetical protein